VSGRDQRDALSFGEYPVGTITKRTASRFDTFVSHSRCVVRGYAPKGDYQQEQYMSHKHPASEHHHHAAAHHEKAARHHREAAKHYEDGDHETAAHHAHTATGHGSHAHHHTTEAGKLHVHHHGEHKE